jgi:predicted HTH transcriptional regulator
MEIEELKEIIKEDENTKVDFKQKWYEYSEAKKPKIDNEFIRDMFALVNGDIYSLDKTAYLIIGVIDETKKANDFDKSKIDHSLDKFKRQLLQTLNNYAQPSFLALNVEWIEYQEQSILVLAIPPHERLIYLSKDLILEGKTIPKRTVYYRVGTSVKIADIDVIKDFEKAFEKNENKGGMVINQTHSGSGDNIARDKIIYQKSE